MVNWIKLQCNREKKHFWTWKISSFRLLDACAKAVGAILKQVDDKNRTQVLLCELCILTGSEENCSILLSIDRLYLRHRYIQYKNIQKIPKHPLTFFSDEKPIFSLLASKRAIKRQCFRCRMKFVRLAIAKNFHLPIFWVELFVPNILKAVTNYKKTNPNSIKLRTFKDLLFVHWIYHAFEEEPISTSKSSIIFQNALR